MLPERKPGFRLAAAAVALAAVVVVLGAWTRLVDAGLGCPDWPGCYGHLTVPGADEVEAAQARYPAAPFEAAKAWPEMIHRYAAGTLGLVVLALAGVAWRHRDDPRVPLRLPLALVALVVCQAAFGAWTVTLKLWPQIVTAHLLGGFATLALLFLLMLRLGWRPRGAGPEVARARRRLASLATVALAVVVAQIALGGWTSANYAALACPDLPTCQHRWWPDADFARGFDVTQSVGPNYLGGRLASDARVAIHFAHRLGAIAATAAVLTLIVALLRAPPAMRVNGFAAVLGAVLALQLALGVANVMLGVPLAVATAHNAVGAGLLLVIVSVNYRMHSATRDPTR